MDKQRLSSYGFLIFTVFFLCVVWEKPAVAEPVQESFRGLILNGNLELAPQIKRSEDVILIVPGGNHRMELVRTLQDLFKESGINSLAFTVSLMISDRKSGFICDETIRHTLNDKFSEIDFWLDWLRKRGFKSISILGHSQGGTTVALFSARGLPSDVLGTIILSPNHRSYGKLGIKRYQTRYKVQLSDVLARADKLIAAGKEDELMKETDFALCPAAEVTPRAFVDRYRLMNSHNWPEIWRNAEKPMLIIGGSADEIAPSIEDDATLATENSNIRLHIVEDAGHFFRDLFADEVVEVISEFLSSIK